MGVGVVSVCSRVLWFGWDQRVSGASCLAPLGRYLAWGQWCFALGVEVVEGCLGLLAWGPVSVVEECPFDCGVVPLDDVGG